LTKPHIKRAANVVFQIIHKKIWWSRQNYQISSLDLCLFDKVLDARSHSFNQVLISEVTVSTTFLVQSKEKSWNA